MFLFILLKWLSHMDVMEGNGMVSMQCYILPPAVAVGEMFSQE